MNDPIERPDVPVTPVRSVRVPPPGPRRPSATRAQSSRRGRLAYLARRGNTNALVHGVFAIVANQPDVEIEVELVYATHPALDRLADRRLVELYASANVMRQRALVAMQTGGLTPVLTSYDARLAPMLERLEQKVHDRERRRLAERNAKQVVDLSAFAPPRRASGAKQR